MNVSVLQEKLAKGLASVSRVVSAKPTLPILSNVLLVAKKGRLQLTATDLNLGVRLWIGAKVKKEGEITVPAKVFGELVSSFSPATVKIVQDRESLRISCAGNKARLAGIAASEFPSLGEVSGKRGFSVGFSQFSEAVQRVTIAASSDETRPVLSGVLWRFSDGALQLAATDGYRLSLVDFGAPEKKAANWLKNAKRAVGKGVIVPARALRDVERLAQELRAREVKIGVIEGQRLAVFTFGDGEVTTRLIEGAFPNFSQVIPKEEKGVSEIELEALEKSVRTAAIFARDSANIIQWKIERSRLIVSANAPTYGESESYVEVSLKGEGGEIAFNSRYLLELFSIFPAKRVFFSMKEGLDPGVFRPAGKQKNRFLHLIMPVRVQK